MHIGVEQNQIFVKDILKIAPITKLYMHKINQDKFATLLFNEDTKKQNHAVKQLFFLNITMWAGVPSEPLCLHTQSLATAQQADLRHPLSSFIFPDFILISIFFQI
eukprot:TRINITY_DN951_c0_g1_i3.p5 TRINITY_DN951_c0_g1~~TRINITY_DN951_c0_g1_i3.p5  ORF type:complete len:106 (+),score=6.22 TRINITY_DN951_c0_g1_i3:152-469(+)